MDLSTAALTKQVEHLFQSCLTAEGMHKHCPSTRGGGGGGGGGGCRLSLIAHSTMM